ncbi:NERD domain-containing protein [Streptomyces pacificus]|uniref:NERD domain-containing protein n=1 Tax=Streptomyces pacificus TaxID=2705029 RepID=UPI00156514A3|nr:NERD domain-containing protein [Streptomyces pacificus]
MRDGRWTTVTESQFQHERSGLLHLKELLPDEEPYRAWSNFTFTAHSGHVREVDLLVAAPSGLFLVELKSWQGTVASSEYGDRLDARSRSALLRQLAEAVHYAHRHRLYHRALHARAIHVLPGPARRRPGGPLAPARPADRRRADGRAAPPHHGRPGRFRRVPHHRPRDRPVARPGRVRLRGRRPLPRPGTDRQDP